MWVVSNRALEFPRLSGGILGTSPRPFLAHFFGFDRVLEVSSESPDRFRVAERQ